MSTSNWKRNIILFLSSQTISLFGSALVQYAIMWHITLSTESGVIDDAVYRLRVYPDLYFVSLCRCLGGPV
ncbi:hypothetical protein D3C73_1247220 [compost metagenome]